MSITSWRKMIQETFDQTADDWGTPAGTGDSWADVESCTLDAAALDKEFDNGYGGTEGEPFTLWTKRYVYFPVCYDGAESVGFVSRNPDGKPSVHWGGG